MVSKHDEILCLLRAYFDNLVETIFKLVKEVPHLFLLKNDNGTVKSMLSYEEDEFRR